MRSMALTAADVKIMVFQDETSCSLTDGYQNFGGTCCPNLQSAVPEDGGSRFLYNFDNHL
jgi:hypothetical protein